MRDNRDYPRILRGLFPGHPAKRLLCTSVVRNESGGAKKKVVTIHRGAGLEDYSKHLDRKSYDGLGALGIIPTFPKSIGEKTRWFVWFLALDYDSISMQEIMTLIAVLEEYRVYVYVDQGTTGRGVHLYIFLSGPLLQREAHEVLVTIANLSKHLGLPYPEFMPSSTSGPGKGIFLPYRGAAEDGLGANPLIDPIGGVQIPLDAADPDAVDSEVFRTEVGDLRTLIENLGGGSKSTTSHESSYNPIDISTYGGGLRTWDAEMTRLKEIWVEGRRQYLTLGATAYGISLGMTAVRIKEDIEALERASTHPEVDERLKAVDRTIEKHVKGQRIAWRKFYNLADVEPPGANKMVPWEVILRLQILEDRLRSVPFKGMGGFTDLDVLDSLIEVGRKYGKLHPEGVEISISVRDLALVARTSKDTILKSIKRLRKAGWIKRSNYGQGTNSGSLVLLIDEDLAFQELTNEDENKGVDEETTFHIPRFRWRSGNLGKTARPILMNLQRLQPCTKADVARAMGRKSRDIRNPMNRLWDDALVDHDEDTNTYTLPTDFQDRLFEVLLANGTLETDFRHKERFERERNMFRLLLHMKQRQRERSRGETRGG